MPAGGGISAPGGDKQEVKTASTENPPASGDPPAKEAATEDAPPAAAEVYDDSFTFAPFDQVKMCALSFERLIGLQCELN